jgi:hypothetical protein
MANHELEDSLSLVALAVLVACLLWLYLNHSTFGVGPVTITGTVATCSAQINRPALVSMACDGLDL